MKEQLEDPARTLDEVPQTGLVGGAAARGLECRSENQVSGPAAWTLNTHRNCTGLRPLVLEMGVMTPPVPDSQG